MTDDSGEDHERHSRGAELGKTQSSVSSWSASGESGWTWTKAEGAGSAAASRATAWGGGSAAPEWFLGVGSATQTRNDPGSRPEGDPEGGPGVVHVSVPNVGVQLSMWGGIVAV